MGEVLEYEAAGTEDSLDPGKEADIQEVLNYRRAMREATESLRSLPLCNRVLKSLHAILLSGVRGHNKAPGEFRKVQNHIGTPGCSIEEARFAPIAPDDLEAGMTRWESYLHTETPDVLVQTAIVHAEFESLHPFLDGNGRIGRIILPLYLFARQRLHSPMFYLSEYLEAHRDEYCDRLLAVSRDDDWTGWCASSSAALIDQAVVNQDKAQKILTLYDRRKEWIVSSIHSQHSIRALDFLFNTPIFSSTQFIEQSRIPAPTARRLLTLLARENTIEQVREGRGRLAAIYAFPELLNITEGRVVL